MIKQPESQLFPPPLAAEELEKRVDAAFCPRECESLKAERHGNKAISAECAKYGWCLMISRKGRPVRYRKCCFDEQKAARAIKKAEEKAKSGNKVKK